MAAEDVEVVMASASMLEQAGEELARVIKNRDRIMRNRNNKQEELRELREKLGEIEAAHRQHLRTGDYHKLGMDVQDILQRSR